MNGQSSIRDFIAFPKNNMGILIILFHFRDMMIDAPSPVPAEQLGELNLAMRLKKEA